MKQATAHGNAKTVPELSIVIPVYNGRKYIEDTLTSLETLEQSLSCELIFQNCCSSDGTTEVLDRFCQGHTNRFHYNEKDAGQSDAINTGTARARGRWVTWLCADDIILPTVTLAIAEANEAGADVVYGDVVFVQDENAFPAIGTEAYTAGALARRRLIIQQPGTCILNTVWQEANGVNLHLNWAMDYDLFMRLESKGKQFLRTSHFLAIIRIHPEAKTSSGSVRRLFELWSIIAKSHVRQLRYVSLRPYLVYFVEYVIKALESGDGGFLHSRCKGVLPLLHSFFWRLAILRENSDIHQRFQALSGEANYLIQKLTTPTPKQP